MWIDSRGLTTLRKGRTVTDRPHIRLCPICQTKLPRSLRSIFCSDRCRRIDLSRWLSEEYRIQTGEEEGDGVLVRSSEGSIGLEQNLGESHDA